MDNAVVRYTPPSRLDLATYGTIVKVMGEGNDAELYIQLSKDETTALWKKIRHLLEVVFSDFLSNKEFIDACLEVQDGHKESLDKISLLIKRPIQ